MLSGAAPFHLPLRLWQYIMGVAGIRQDIRRGEVGGKGFRKLSSSLTATPCHIDGRNHFRDEFVTCGGVDLSAVDPSTMQCRRHPRLFFAGEVLDIDAITGGFNLQAAWSTGYLCAQGILKAIQAG